MDKQNIETLYPLAPLQQAFLWHSLQASSQAGLLHMRCTLCGELDPKLLRQAWEFVVSQHPALRTSVHWQAVKQPLQVVAKQVTLPWVQLDWRDHANPQESLTEFLERDRDLGFDLTQAPISRIALIQLSTTDYELIWSCHHLTLDGWSGALVLNQVIDTYETLHQGNAPTVKPAPTYQTYLRWLKQQDEAAAATFWQQTLQGFTTPTPFPPCPPTPLLPHFPTPLFTLSSKQTAELQTFLRSHRLTLNTLMQGVWALLLHRYSGESDVLFGATISGRQADLAGVEAIVGLLINVLPVRVALPPNQTVVTWLQTLQTQQAEASRYAYASPDQIQTWSPVSGRLFDSLLVIENYPVRVAEANCSVQVDNVQSGLVSTYGLTVIVKPGDTLTLMLRADSERFSNEQLATLLDQFQEILSAIADHPHRTIREILPALAETITDGTQPGPPVPNALPNLSREQLEGRFFAPSNSLELKLTQIWEAVLGVHPLSVEDSFFDVGGDSLLAVQLFNQMQMQLNCTLPLATLFQAPNVRKFAALLNQEQPVSPWTSLVPIQPSGSRRPLFFHGGSADALTWARFSHLLGPDQPFYALQRPDLDGSEVIHNSVEALAADCIQEMRMVQPNGPYLVGGHCFGGAVAFEIAQQLQAQGEAIVSIVLIDAYRPEPPPDTTLLRLQGKLQLGVFWLRKNYYYHGGWEKLALLPSKVWRRLKPSRSCLDSSPQNPPTLENFEAQPSPELGSSGALDTNDSAIDRAASSTASTQTVAPKIPYEYRYARAQKANALATENYVPQPYSGRVKLFRANIQILDWYFGPELGWQIVAKDNVDMTKIPGFFGNLFNQRSGPILAEQVKTYLATLQHPYAYNASP